MEGNMSSERKLIKVLAKRARDFLQSLADMMKGYLGDDDEDSKESVVPKKKTYVKKTIKKYKKQSKKSAKKAKPVKKIQKDPNAPKKPLPAFLLFSNYRRKQMKDLGVSTFCNNISVTIKGKIRSNREGMGMHVKNSKGRNKI